MTFGRSRRLDREWGRATPKITAKVKPTDKTICAWCDKGNKKIEGEGRCQECKSNKIPY